MPKPETRETILHAKRAPVGGLALMTLGGLVLAAGAWGLVVESSGAGARGLLALVALALGGGLLRGGQLLWLPKGGLDLVEQRGRHLLAWRELGAVDLLRLPVDEVQSVRLVPRDEQWRKDIEVRNWSCELIRDDGCAVVAAESTDYDSIWALGRALQRLTGSRLDELAKWSPPEGLRADGAAPTEGRRRLGAGRRGRLLETLLGIGLAAAVIGGLLMSRVSVEPVFGFLFGPTLLIMGLSFVALVLSGRHATDEIWWNPSRLGRRSRWGHLAWGGKELSREEPAYPRLQPLGLQGASLEIVGPRSTLVVVGGVPAASRVAPRDLLSLGDELAALTAPPIGQEKP